jgi:DNA modification methylase
MTHPTPTEGLPIGQIVQGDSLDVLRGWPAGQVQLVMTSPAYLGLRDYKAGGQSLPGQWGSEATPEEHVARLVEWAREVRRVLRPDGVLVLNYGESYQDKQLRGMPWRIAQALQADGWYWRAWWPWVKLNGMPESTRDRPALSCEAVLMFSASARYHWDQEAVRVGYTPASIERADGSQVTTGNPDVRPGFKRTLSKMPDNWDTGRGSHGNHHRNGREKGAPGEIPAHGRIRKTGDWWRESLPLAIAQAEAWLVHARAVQAGETPMLLDFDGLPLGQLHPTYAYPGSHFATYPPALVRPVIRAATSERGQCPACGAPWVREVAVSYTENRKGHAGRAKNSGESKWAGDGKPNVNRHSSTTGWRPTCACNAGEPVPQIVLDPFAGTGTTCVVAAEEGRRTLGIDLYGGDYDFGGHTAMDRLRAAMGSGPALDAVRAARAGQTTLLGEGV